MNRRPLRGRVAHGLGLFAIACGARSEPTDARPRLETGGDDGTIGNPRTGSGGVTVGSGGARSSGGRTGTGGRGAGGATVASGGRRSTAGTGGAATGGRSSDALRLLPFICREPCDARAVCPSAEPFAGGCNQVSQRCIITCEKGCPPGTQALSVAGGCFCYIPDVSITGLAGDGRCCAEHCGPPYYLPCCSGETCRADGACTP